MKHKNEAALWLAGSVVGVVLLQKVGKRQAAILGLTPLAFALLVALATQLLKKT